MKLDSLLSSVSKYLNAEQYACDRELRREETARLKVQVDAAKASLAREHAAPVSNRTGSMFQRILVAVDESLPARWAAEVAARVATDSGARLVLMHAVPSSPGGRFATEEAITEPLDVRHERADVLLRDIELTLPGRPRVEKITVAGDPRREVVQAAQDWGADLIVIGTHARGRFSNFILGSTAESVVRRATCPVLTVAHDPVAMRKVKDLLDAHAVRYVSVLHSPAYTAQEVAHSVHVRGRELAKTTIVSLDGELAMVVLPANERVDLERLKEVAGAGAARVATESEFCGLFPDCEPGAMPPFGNLYGMRVFVAEDLARAEQIAFNAGSHTEVIRMTYRDYEKFVHPVVAPVAAVPAACS